MLVKAIGVLSRVIVSRKGISWLALLLVVFLVSTVPAIVHANSQKFDRVVWQANTNDSSPNNLRSQMLGDLQRHYLRIGMTKQQVQQLLGVPEEHKASTDIYKVGYMGWFTLDPTILELRYDGRDILLDMKVIEY